MKTYIKVKLSMNRSNLKTRYISKHNSTVAVFPWNNMECPSVGMNVKTNQVVSQWIAVLWSSAEDKLILDLEMVA